MPTTITAHGRAMSALADAGARALAEAQAAEARIVGELARPLCAMSGQPFYGAPRREFSYCPRCDAAVFVTSAGRAARHVR